MSLLSPEARAALASLARAVDADHGASLYLDRGDGVFELVATDRPDQVAADRSNAQGEGSRLGRWFRNGDRSDAESAAPPGAVARLSLPDERAGMLVLERSREEAFTEEDLAIARVQARQLVANVTTRLGRRPIAWAAQFEVVQSIAAQLTRLTSVEEVSEALCSQTQRVVSFDNARVYVLRDDGRTLDPVAFRPHAPEYRGESAAGLRVMVGEGITGWVAASGQQLIVGDAARDRRGVQVPGTAELAEESMLLAPLRSEAGVIGVVVLSRLGLDRFSEDESRLLGVLADQAAVAIENARLLAERDRHVSELAALLDISRAGGSESTERDLADLLARKLRSASRMDACIISRWDEEAGRLVPIGSDGRPLIGPERDLSAHRSLRHALLHDEPVWLDPEIDALEPSESSRLRALGGAAMLIVPLSTAGRVVGLVEFVAHDQGRRFHDGETALLRTMANQAASALENARLVRKLRDAAETDLVTGIYSHRHLQDRARQEVARAVRSGSALSILMVDLDDFKHVNDEFGHQAGDQVLRSIAGALRAAVRAGDVVARYGGDEFVVLMPDTSDADAVRIAERAAQAVAALEHAMGDGRVVRVTCSVGLATHPGDGRSAKELLQAADSAMYARKRARGSGMQVRPADAGATAPAVSSAAPGAEVTEHSISRVRPVAPA